MVTWTSSRKNNHTTSAAGASASARKGPVMTPTVSRAAALDTKIEVLRVQLAGVDLKITEFIAETRQWREAGKQDTADARIEFEERLSKHEAQDDRRHSAVDSSIKRLEDETLAAGKEVLKRVEVLEQDRVATIAVAEYKKQLTVSRRWLISLAIGLALSLLAHVPTIFGFLRKL